MKLITDLSDDAKQLFKVQIENAEVATIKLYFLPTQAGWFFDLTYGDFVATGLRLTNSPNVLSNYLNVLRFGLLCRVNDGAEPYFIDDFTTERVKLYVLSYDEVEALEKTLYA